MLCSDYFSLVCFPRLWPCGPTFIFNNIDLMNWLEHRIYVGQGINNRFAHLISWRLLLRELKLTTRSLLWEKWIKIIVNTNLNTHPWKQSVYKWRSLRLKPHEHHSKSIWQRFHFKNSQIGCTLQSPRELLKYWCLFLTWVWCVAYAPRFWKAPWMILMLTRVESHSISWMPEGQLTMSTADSWPYLFWSYDKILLHCFYL